MYKVLALAAVALASPAPQKTAAPPQCGANGSCPTGLTCSTVQGSVGVCIVFNGPIPSGTMPSGMPMPSGMTMPSGMPMPPPVNSGSSSPATQAPAPAATTDSSSQATTTKGASTTTAATGNGAEKVGLGLAAALVLFAL
ncbi:hypothetical protein HDV06_004429 [Boothiomyces sp. JEL0866]|nr:hypothetical protein HDV06_004429 [Boothiomyces sp. JEL0866]